VIWDNPPKQILPLLQEDRTGIGTLRP